MNQSEMLFAGFGNEIVMGNLVGGCLNGFTVEDLYQAFKARMLEEMRAELLQDDEPDG